MRSADEPTRHRRGTARGHALAGGLVLAGLAQTACYAGLDDPTQDGAAAGTDGADESTGGGEEGESGGVPDGMPGLCEGELGVAPRPLSRLTPAQYQNTIRDLLGDPGFVTEYDALERVITEAGVRQLRDGAEAAWARRGEWSRPVFACDPTGPADDACITAFLDEFAPRAFRRQLTAAERAWLQASYETAVADVGFEDALAILFQSVLQAPALIYREEVGTPIDGLPDDLRRLTDREIASRLSYFLWDTMPDDTLFAAADAGRLRTSETRADEVDRMLADPRALAGIQRLVWQWLELDGGTVHFALEESEKDPELFPEYNAALADAMHVELDALVGRVLTDEGGDFTALLTSTDAYVNGPLAALYGVADGPTTPDEWAWVELDPAQRGGLLTRAAFLTVYASARVQSPIQRGVSVIEDVLCAPLPDPPENANDVPPQGSDADDETPVTVREETEARTSAGDCVGCHRMINPVGFAFEHYDALGRWQQQELTSGLPIDSSGEITLSDVEGPVANAVDLSERLATSIDVRGCFADYWFGRAVELGELDACERERIAAEFAASPSIATLAHAITSSNAFLYVNLAPEEN